MTQEDKRRKILLGLLCMALVCPAVCVKTATEEYLEEFRLSVQERNEPPPNLTLRKNFVEADHKLGATEKTDKYLDEVDKIFIATLLNHATEDTIMTSDVSDPKKDRNQTSDVVREADNGRDISVKQKQLHLLRSPVFAPARAVSPKDKKVWLVVCLLLISGMTEAICNRRFGCHPNMMTGNTVKCMDALAVWKLDSVLKLSCMIFHYVAGAAFFSCLKHFWSDHQINTPLLILVARISFVCFGLSDVIARGLKPGLRQDTLRLVALAIGFGMINAAANNEVRTVTNAVTGHWTDVGLGMAEYLLLPTDQTPEEWKTSVKAVGSFLLSLLATNLAYKQILEKSSDVSVRHPPLGAGLGVLYYIVLSWYSHQA